MSDAPTITDPTTGLSIVRLSSMYKPIEGLR